MEQHIPPRQPDGTSKLLVRDGERRQGRRERVDGRGRAWEGAGERRVWSERKREPDTRDTREERVQESERGRRGRRRERDAEPSMDLTLQPGEGRDPISTMQEARVRKGEGRL